VVIELVLLDDTDVVVEVKLLVVTELRIGFVLLSDTFPESVQDVEVLSAVVIERPLVV